MPVKPVKRNIVSEEIFEQMLGFIASGEWKPGEKIPSEAELKELFSVSRISVREALQKLSALGLINPRPGLGTFVTNVSSGLYLKNLIPVLLLDKPDVQQVLEFRMALEVEGAKLAALKATDEDIVDLEKALQEIRNSANDMEKYSESDLKFHNLIFGMTKNPLFIKVSLLLQQILQEGFLQQTEASQNFEYQQHEDIFKAIEARDPTRAIAAMSAHINSTIERITS